ncbi:MAG: MFS transporter [Verrucomicrobia bacterium]|nr:MFS transporter [Verrucomicrobiota bacterium]
MRRSIFASVFGSSFAVCIALQFLTGFALTLEASKMQIALLTSLPMFGLALPLISTLLLHHVRERKRCWFPLVTGHTLIWLVIAIVPFLTKAIGFSGGMALFLSLFFLSCMLGSMSVPLWFSWMSDLVPRQQAGKYWGRRMAMVSLVQVLAIPVGWLTDCFPPNNPLPYAGIFALAGILGFTSVLIQRGVVEPPTTVLVAGKSVWQSLREPFQHADFRKLIQFSCFYNFAVLFADGFVVLFFLTEIGADRGITQSSLAMAASLMWLIRWVMGRYWGFLGDRFGHAAVLRLCTAALVIWPLALVLWGRSHPMQTLMGIHLYMGLFNVGFETSITALQLGLAPAPNRPMFVTVQQACAGLVAAVAPLLGGAFLQWSTEHPGWLGSLDPYQTIFLFGMLLRLTCAVSFPLRFQVAKGASAAMLVRRLMDSNPFKVIHHSYVLDEGIQESERVDAVHELADAGSDIATEQVLHALRDPSLEVRRGAVRALVEIKDRSSLTAILEAAHTPETQIQSEAIESLGHFGDRSVTAFLLERLNDPVLRLPALRALSHLGDPSARESLRHWARDPSAAPEVRATAFEAWCHLSDEDSIAPCLRFMRECRHDLPRWQAAMALAKMAVAPVDFYSVLQQELRVRGETVTAQTHLVDHAPVAREKPLRLRQAATHLTHRGQSSYAEGKWGDAAQAFTLAALACLEIIHPAVAQEAITNPAGFQQALASLEQTITELAVTRSRLVLSLRLAEAMLRLENLTPRCSVSEEAILAHCLLRKLLGY